MKEIEAGWPEKVLKRQRDWVGQSEGAYLDFAVKESGTRIRVFTTRIDTIFGATALVLAVEHPLLEELLENSSVKGDVLQFAENVKALRAARESEGDEEKEGIST